MVRSPTDKNSTFYIGAAVWTLLCAWLIQNELAVIAVLGSAFLGLYVFGLRDKFASETTPSAYSVFNEDGRAIAGGLTGEQVDQQLRGGVANDSSNSGRSYSKSKSKQSSSPLVVNLSPDQRLKRRQAAAKAAERRFGATASRD